MRVGALENFYRSSVDLTFRNPSFAHTKWSYTLRLPPMFLMRVIIKFYRSSMEVHSNSSLKKTFLCKERSLWRACLSVTQFSPLGNRLFFYSFPSLGLGEREGEDGALEEVERRLLALSSECSCCTFLAGKAGADWVFAATRALFTLLQTHFLSFLVILLSSSSLSLLLFSEEDHSGCISSTSM